ncbi:glutamine--fructose-6-phosphate transaminase (isomerizing), partial [Candidatus Aerophobetes bacterium]
MCGIVGYIGDKAVDTLLIVSLERLEYRGYDSAGMATLNGGKLGIRKQVGKIQILKEILKKKPLEGQLGIAHTRWATHGEPTTENAHPHTGCKNEVAIVHNGIIENYAELRDELLKEGHILRTDTDTEVIAHLVEKHLNKSLLVAVQKAVKRLEGSYALAVISIKDPDKIVVARYRSPLVIGIGKNENFVASDASALLHLTSNMIFMEDGQVGFIAKRRVKVLDREGRPVEKKVKIVKWHLLGGPQKDGYRHFMLKEIHEQPVIIRNTLQRRISQRTERIYFEHTSITEEKLPSISRVIIQACGTSWHAGLVGKYLFEKYLRLHTEVDLSSEFRYRMPVVRGDTLVMAISQSGETAD